MLAHKAVHEAHVAAEVIAGELQGNKELASAAFNARVIPSVAYTDPEVAWVGLTEDQAKAQGIKVKKGLFPWTASGRAIANGRDEGVTKLLFDDSPEAHGHGKILGGGMVGTHAGDMIGEIALAIEMGADAVDIGKTIHPHPTLGESIGMAAEVAHGSCTDVPPARKPAAKPLDKARTGNGSGFVLCVPKQSPQNTVHLYSIYADHCKTQALQPTPPRTHAAVPNGSRALRDLARVGQRGSVRRPVRPPHPQALVCKAFAKYLECGIFAHGFARVRCGDCGHNYFVAFSCKGRGVCPSCTTRRLVETAAHLTDHVFPRLPVRQWVLSVPKRLRYFMQRDGAVLNMVLRIFLRVIAQTLQTHSPGAAHMDKAGLHIGAIAFIHRFGSSLTNTSTSTFVLWTGCLRKWRARAMLMRPSNLIAGCHLSRGHRHRCGYRGPSADHTAKRILRAFVARGLLENCDAKDMLGYQHSGFSVDAGVCIEAHDRAALERLLRYCARPPFSMDRLRKEGSELVYRCAKQRSEPTSDQRGAKADELVVSQ
jgi:hypothetical protein